MATPVAQDSVHHGSKRSSPKLGSGLGFSVLVVVAVMLGALAQSGACAASTAPVAVLSGCPGTVAMMPNVNCADGVIGEVRAEAAHAGDRAPWCSPNHDATVYGCVLDRKDLDRSCDASAPWTIATIEAQALAHQCEPITRTGLPLIPGLPLRQ